MGMSNRIELDVAERFVFAGGQDYGAAGAYERIKGRARFAVDPGAPAQAGIVDLDKAPRDADGLVRFAAMADCSSTTATGATFAACSSSTTRRDPTTRAPPPMPGMAS
jgi:hypothetical protein